MKKIAVVFISLLGILTACDGGASNTADVAHRTNQTTLTNTGGGGGGGTGSGRGSGRSEEQSPVTQQVSLDQAANSQTQPTVTERKIIRNADLELEANAPEEVQQKIAAITESKGGFVIESTQSSSDVKVTTRDVITMTVRVPAEKFNEALGEIRQSGNRVIIETVKGQDVTEEFVDIEARLKAKKALEEQFIEIMKRSNSVADALNVQRELSNVRGEIEQIEGRKRFLENQTSLSTIKIRIQTPTAFSASSSGFFYQLQQAVSSGFSFALNFILVLITLFIGLLPFLIFIVLPVYLLIRYLLRRNQKRKLASEIAKEEIGEQ